MRIPQKQKMKKNLSPSERDPPCYFLSLSVSLFFSHSLFFISRSFSFILLSFALQAFWPSSSFFLSLSLSTSLNFLSLSIFLSVLPAPGLLTLPLPLFFFFFISLTRSRLSGLPPFSLLLFGSLSLFPTPGLGLSLLFLLLFLFSYQNQAFWPSFSSLSSCPTNEHSPA